MKKVQEKETYCEGAVSVRVRRGSSLRMNDTMLKKGERKKERKNKGETRSDCKKNEANR